MGELEQRWREAGFVAAAHAWIDDRLATLGRTRTGEVEQLHVTDWSTVMRVPTDRGPVWFKAYDEAMVHEAAVLDLVASRSEGRVPPPLAREPGTGWMLLADAGQRLRDVIPEERSLPGGTTCSRPTPASSSLARTTWTHSSRSACPTARLPAAHPARGVRRPRHGIPMTDLREAAGLAMRLGWVCRAVNGALPQDPERTHVRLRMFLDGKP